MKNTEANQVKSKQQLTNSTRMKQKYNSNKKNQKARKEHVTRPFEGKINQLKREKVVLCNMVQFEDFKKALTDADVDYDLGDFFGDGIIVVKK